MGPTGRLDVELVAVAEWSLDRHRARAIRLLSAGVGDPRELCDLLENYVNETAHRPRHSSPSAGDSRELAPRLLRVLRVLAPAPRASGSRSYNGDWSRAATRSPAALRP